MGIRSKVKEGNLVRITEKDETTDVAQERPLSEQRKKAITTECKKLHRELHMMEDHFKDSKALFECAHENVHNVLTMLGLDSNAV